MIYFLETAALPGLTRLFGWKDVIVSSYRYPTRYFVFKNSTAIYDAYQTNEIKQSIEPNNGSELLHEYWM